MAFIAGILFYIFLLQKIGSPIKTALVFVIGYTALQSITTGLLFYAQGVPVLPNLFNLVTVSTALLQFVAATLVFYKVNESGDEYLSYALWGGIGLATIFFLVPLSVQIVVVTL